MPLRLNIKKNFSQRTERVKSVDIHPTEPWVLSALYSGHVNIWNFETQTSVKSFEVTEQPVRCAKFVSRKQWVVAASDDMNIRAFNYNTMEKIKSFEAHTDYIRCIVVHPVHPYLISSSDDMQIKLWDWDKSFACIQVFEGHTHYVMQVCINPKDTNTFASASLDRSIKVWTLGSQYCNFTLEGHERGVNCVDYYSSGDKPYLLSGADDNTVKIWDYQTKTCVQNLEGHSNNISGVAFHPRLPIIITSIEDGTVRIWHNTTYRAETTLNYGMERSWCISTREGTNKIALGYDEGMVVIGLGHEEPIISMDPSGKVVWADNNEIQSANVKNTANSEIADNEKLQLVSKDLGSCDIYPQALKHNCNGRFIVILGDGEYITYTAQTLRNKTYGPALDFVWSSVGTGDYCIRESTSKIKTFKNFKDGVTMKPRHCSAEELFGGPLVGVRGSDCIVFYDWDELKIVRKIEVLPKSVIWSESGDLVVLACDDSFFVLKYNREAVASGEGWDEDDGVDGAFDLLHEIGEKVGTGKWVGDCFLYTNSANRLNYYVGGETMTICHLDSTMFLLGYLPKENKVYLIDKNSNIVSFTVLQSLLEYQTFVVRGDFDTANDILPNIPQDQYGAVAQFLESQGFKEQALEVTPDNDQKFDLALQLGKLELATEIMKEKIGVSDTTDSQLKWKQLGDMALSASNIKLMEECALNSGDLSGLLLLYSSTGDGEGMKRLAQMALQAKKNNVAFLCLFLTHDLEACIKLLIDTKRLPEAAFMARTYLPSMASEVLQLWKSDLSRVSDQASQALADPSTYPDLFPDLEYAVKAEELFKASRGKSIPAGAYPQAKQDLKLDLIEEMKKLGEDGKAVLRDFAAEAAEQRRLENEQRMQEEEAKKAEAALKAKAEAERLRAERQSKKAISSQKAEQEAEQKRLADQKREQEELQRRQQAEADEEARRLKEIAQEREAQLVRERQEEAHRLQEEERQRREKEEMARLKAEKEKKAREDQEAREAEERRKQQELEEMQRIQQQQEEERRRKEEDERKAIEEAKQKAEEERRLAEEALQAAQQAADAGDDDDDLDFDDDDWGDNDDF